MEQKQDSGLPRAAKGVLLALGAVLIAVVFFFAGWFARWFSFDGRTRSFLWALETARSNFYQDIDEAAFYEKVFGAFELDPYSEYYTKSEYDAIYSSNAGNSVGIGVSVVSSEEKAVIYRVVGNSPAERAGLKSGMTIFRFGSAEDSLTAATYTELLTFIRAQTGEFFLECGYDGEEAELVCIAPAPYRVSYCLYRDSGVSYRFDPVDLTNKFPADEPLEGLPEDTAYIRVSEFHGTAAQEFAQCLSLMKERGKSHLVIDLRGNGGGYLSVFCEMAGYLLKDATGNHPVVASAKYKSGHVTRYSAGGNYYSNYFGADSKVYLLADENTASASECLIGALVSYGTVSPDTIYLHGDDETAHSYGKGIMQSSFQDSRGNVLKLTVAEVFWPNEKSIHGVGVVAKDRAHAIPAPTIPGKEDVFLTEFLNRM